MREGDRLIKLFNPSDLSEQGTIEAYAVREDKGGSRRLIADATILAGEWTTLFTVRESAAYRDIDESWEIIDERGVKFEIERVSEISSGSAARHLRLYATRNDARSGGAIQP